MGLVGIGVCRSFGDYYLVRNTIALSDLWEDMKNFGERFSGHCPHCNSLTWFTPAPVKYHDSYGDEGTARAIWAAGTHVWWIGICNGCNSPVLVRNSGDVVYPATLPSSTDELIPEDIRTSLIEAKLCKSVGAIRAAAVMARRCVQCACINKGASTKASLVDQIAQLRTDGKITEDIKAWADGVRWIGNDAAHVNAYEVTEQDAEDVLQLAEQMLHVLYVAPAKALDLKNRLGKS